MPGVVPIRTKDRNDLGYNKHSLALRENSSKKEGGTMGKKACLIVTLITLACLTVQTVVASGRSPGVAFGSRIWYLCTFSQLEQDIDGDSIADSLDNCPCTPNTQQENANGDGVGNACD